MGRRIEEPTELTIALAEAVGEGATSTVHRAQMAGRDCALKIGRHPSMAAALAAEGWHGALLRSPRLPQTVDLGFLVPSGEHARLVPPEGSLPAGARPFLALAWRDGASLDRWPDVSGRVAAGIAADAAAALEVLHTLGLAHGDVKPANVLVDADGAAGLLDLGLCGPVDAPGQGATARYLGLGDARLGDARARDLLALGLLVAEIASPVLRSEGALLPAARRASLPEPFRTVVAALLAPEPGARPSAGWAASLLREAAPGVFPEDSRWVPRASYLRLRRTELLEALEVDEGVTPWAREVLDVARRARALCARAGVRPPAALGEPRGGRLGPLSADQRQRWLGAMTSGTATTWSIATFEAIAEPVLATRLEQLAARRPPSTWTVRDLDEAHDPEPNVPPPSPLSMPLDADAVASTAAALCRVPLDEHAAFAVERLGELAPVTLRVAAADALRLSGQLGRARALVIDLPGPVAADVLRRSGDEEAALSVARAATHQPGGDPHGRARAAAARILFDRNEIDAAERVLEGPTTAATEEVAALLAMRRGDAVAAEQHARRGLALAHAGEPRARLAGALAYVLHGRDLAQARAGFAEAVAHATQAGAVLEEATYRTGEAAACVDLGELETAIVTARRAALLWEAVLCRGEHAVRAWLNVAAAYAALGAAAEATAAARAAIERAHSLSDARAQAYAWWAIADAQPAGSREGREAAARAAEQLPPDANDDGLQTAARLWRHGAGALDAAHLAELDEAAAGDHASPFGRLAWWGARAERALGESSTPGTRTEAERVVGELLRLASSTEPVATRGRAMHAGAVLAARLELVDAHRQLDAAREEAAHAVRAGTTTFLRAASEACPWLTTPPRHDGPHTDALAPDQARDLVRLVHALSDRSDLHALLRSVVDVLLLWTGAERVLVLLEDETGTLRPEVARNLARDDLGDEQLTVSTQLAEQALRTGEPVVAVDAMQELAESYRSVHTLKLRSVLVLPLAAGGRPLGVVYLDDRMRSGAFGAREVMWARSVAAVASVAIADTRRQVALREAIAEAESARGQLEAALAEREGALEVAERRLAEQDPRRTRFGYEEIVGDSAATVQMLQLIDRVGPSDVPVLLRGESGSGKELVARAIHRVSGRRHGPFVTENCGALPDPLLESALFGHVRGAFTGAHRARLGLFETASGGTLFLDEVGEMSLSMQAKVLRVLEDGVLRPLGTTHTRRVDVRVVAATHRDLEQMIATGSFREDLYYRLNVIGIHVPPLRARTDDVLPLARHFVAKHSGERRVRISSTAGARLAQHPWPGNVRQLENEVRRALLLSDDIIEVRHLSLPPAGSEGGGAPGDDLDLRRRVDTLEAELIRVALERTGGNQTRAAQLLGVSRYGLHKMMRRLGIAAEA